MAVIKFSPIIAEASGSAGPVVFSRWKGQPYIRSRVTPANPDSNDQKGARGVLRKIVAWYHDLAQEVQDALDAVAAQTSVSGFNLFTQRNAQDLAQDPWPEPPVPPTNPLAQIMPLSTPVNPVDSVAAAAGTPAGSINITWDQGSAKTDDKSYVLAELHSTPFDQSAIFIPTGTPVTVQTEALTITNLTPGAVYDLYVMVETAAGGSFSIARPVKATAKAA